MALSSELVSELTFAQVLIGIILAWILISLWKTVVKNFAYGTLGIDRESTWQTFVFALTVTVIFFAVISTVGSSVREIVTGVSEETPIAEPLLNFPTEDTTNNPGNLPPGANGVYERRTTTASLCQCSRCDGSWEIHRVPELSGEVAFIPYAYST